MKRVILLDGERASWRCEPCLKMAYMTADAEMVHAVDDTAVCDVLTLVGVSSNEVSVYRHRGDGSDL